MQPPEVVVPSEMYWMCKETNAYLDALLAACREGKRVEEASRYCRWLQFSGVIKLLERNPQADPLPVDGKAVRRKVADVLDEAAEWLKGGKSVPRYVESDIAQINRKLDELLGERGQRSEPQSRPEALDTLPVETQGAPPPVACNKVVALPQRSY